MKLKKLLTGVTSALLMLTIINPGTIVSAKEKEFKFTKKTKNIISKFPMAEEHLRRNTTGKLVGSTDSYYKFVKEKKELNEDTSIMLSKSGDTTIDNSGFISVTEEEYNSVDLTGKKINEKNDFPSIASYSVIGPDDIQNGDSWMRLTLQVYQGIDSSTFTAYNFWEWKGVPQFTFTDSNFITSDSALIVAKESDVMSQYLADRYDSISNTYLSTDVGSSTNYLGKNGAQQSHNLFSSSSYYPYNYGFLTSNFEFSNKDNHQVANIYGQYIHKQVGFGAIGMDSLGKPSIAFSVIVDKSKSSKVWVEYTP
jgi:hypothetical protein